MEQNQNPQNNQQPQFRCPEDCRRCPQQQRIYCASQHALSNMKVLDMVMGALNEMKGSIVAMQGEVSELAAKIEAIQNSEANVFDPTSTEAEPQDDSEGIKSDDLSPAPLPAVSPAIG